jgi:hypothetical protein
VMGLGHTSRVTVGHPTTEGSAFDRRRGLIDT